VPVKASRDLVGIAAAVTSAFLGGTAAVATRFLVGEWDPLIVALIRYGIAACCLVLAARPARIFRISRAELPVVLGLGTLMFTVFPLLFSFGLAYTTAARGALALSAMPVLTMLLARLTLGEPLTPQRMAGVVLAMTGVAWALVGSASPVGGTWLGDLIMLGTAGIGSIYAVLCRRLLRSDPLLFTARAATLGTLLLASLMVATGGLARLPRLDATGWVVALYLGVLGGALSFWLWNVGLERTSATNVGVAVTVNPVSAMLFGALLLGEPLTPSLGLGLLLVVSGIVLTAMAGRPAAKVAPDAASPSRRCDKVES
jgi:drug/metabolite transporter (DMT)-like permease